MKRKKHCKNVTLAVSRDGVSLGIAFFGNFEMASVATISVYADGQRMKRVRQLLLEPRGWGRAMRSIAGMVQKYGINPAGKEEVETAKRYQHRYQRFMSYSTYRSHGSPVRSGIVESACKQLVTERLKLSGMRWSHAGARQIMTLRSILLSQTWDATFRKALLALPAVNVLNTQQDL